MAAENDEGIGIVDDQDMVRAADLALAAMARMGLTDPDSTELFTKEEQAHYDALLTMFLGEMAAG